MNAPAARLRAAVHQQTRNRIELPPEVETQRSDRRVVAQARADGIAQIAEPHTARLRPHVARVEEEDAAEVAAQRRADFLAQAEHAVAADRKARAAQRTHFVASPPADARRAAEKVLLRERHVRLVEADRPDVAEL